MIDFLLEIMDPSLQFFYRVRKVAMVQKGFSGLHQYRTNETPRKTSTGNSALSAARLLNGLVSSFIVLAFYLDIPRGGSNQRFVLDLSSYHSNNNLSSKFISFFI